MLIDGNNKNLYDSPDSSSTTRFIDKNYKRQRNNIVERYSY